MPHKNSKWYSILKIHNGSLGESLKHLLNLVAYEPTQWNYDILLVSCSYTLKCLFIIGFIHLLRGICIEGNFHNSHSINAEHEIHIIVSSGNDPEDIFIWNKLNKIHLELGIIKLFRPRKINYLKTRAIIPAQHSAAGLKLLRQGSSPKIK